MADNSKDWLKGTLPAWIATGLIGLLCFVGARYLDHVNHKLDQIDVNKAEISVQSAQLHVLQDAVIELKNVQRDMLKELQEVNANLKNAKGK